MNVCVYYYSILHTGGLRRSISDHDQLFVVFLSDFRTMVASLPLSPAKAHVNSFIFIRFREQRARDRSTPCVRWQSVALSHFTTRRFNFSVFLENPEGTHMCTEREPGRRQRWSSCSPEWIECTLCSAFYSFSFNRRCEIFNLGSTTAATRRKYGSVALSLLVQMPDQYHILSLFRVVQGRMSSEPATG